MLSLVSCLMGCSSSDEELVFFGEDLVPEGRLAFIKHGSRLYQSLTPTCLVVVARPDPLEVYVEEDFYRDDAPKALNLAHAVAEMTSKLDALSFGAGEVCVRMWLDKDVLAEHAVPMINILRDHSKVRGLLFCNRWTGDNRYLLEPYIPVVGMETEIYTVRMTAAGSQCVSLPDIHPFEVPGLMRDESEMIGTPVAIALEVESDVTIGELTEYLSLFEGDEIKEITLVSE